MVHNEQQRFSVEESQSDGQVGVSDLGATSDSNTVIFADTVATVLSADCPVTVLTRYQGALTLTWQHLQIQAVSALSLRQPAPLFPGIVWFGGAFSWYGLHRLLCTLGLTEGQIALRLWQPAGLPPAIVMTTPEHFSCSVAELNALAQQLACQLVYLKNAPRVSQPGLLVMDMDSTAIQIECIDEIARLAGVGERVAAVTARAMNGELDFAQSLQQRVSVLAGAPEQILAEVLAKLPLMPGLEDLVSCLKSYGWRVAIASGGFTYFTDALQQQLQLDATFANQLVIKHGYLTGELKGEIVDASRKAEVVRLLAERYGIDMSQTVAIGDGANDLPMLAQAALGVAFHAKPKVQAAAKAAITTGSLLQLLYLVAPE